MLLLTFHGRHDVSKWQGHPQGVRLYTRTAQEKAQHCHPGAAEKGADTGSGSTEKKKKTKSKKKQRREGEGDNYKKYKIKKKKNRLK